MARILVTGGSGVAGRALADLLAKRGEDVRILRGRADGDLEDWSTCRALFEHERPTHVYHLAGAVYGLGGNTAYPGDAFRRNTLLNVHVVEASRLVGVSKIVAMGTAAIYADGLEQPFREEDALAAQPHASEYGYAYAKRSLLVQLQSYKQQYGTSFAYAISTNLYGPHDRFDARFGHVVPSLLLKFAQASRTGETVSVWGNGSPQRDFLYAADAAAGLVAMMESGEGTFNLATGRSVTIRTLVEEVARRFPTVSYSWDSTKPLGQMRREYDTSRLETLGFRPRHTLAQGLDETVAWMEQNVETLRTY